MNEEKTFPSQKEAYLKENPQYNQPSFVVVGLGDLVYMITTMTGIAWIVHKVNKATGFECGCNKRRNRMNNWFAVRWQKWKKTR